MNAPPRRSTAAIALIACLLSGLSAAVAADPTWLAAVAPNDAGGALALGAMQTPPCKGEWFNALTTRPQNKEKPIFHGCWKFTDSHITINWEDGRVGQYQLKEFHWSDWATGELDKPAPPTSAPKPRIEHKPSDIIS